jgi:hypothetical protein
MGAEREGIWPVTTHQYAHRRPTVNVSISSFRPAPTTYFTVLVWLAVEGRFHENFLIFRLRGSSILRGRTRDISNSSSVLDRRLPARWRNIDALSLNCARRLRICWPLSEPYGNQRAGEYPR